MVEGGKNLIDFRFKRVCACVSLTCNPHTKRDHVRRYNKMWLKHYKNNLWLLLLLPRYNHKYLLIFANVTHTVLVSPCLKTPISRDTLYIVELQFLAGQWTDDRLNQHFFADASLVCLTGQTGIVVKRLTVIDHDQRISIEKKPYSTKKKTKLEVAWAYCTKYFVRA